MSGETKIAAIAGFIFVCIVLVSCPLLRPESDFGASGTGSLHIELGAHAGTLQEKTLLPDLDMAPSFFGISGSGPAGSTFLFSTGGTTITFNDLAFGLWQIDVDAYNESGALIGRGSGAAEVRTGETTTFYALIEPAPGQGAFSISVIWNGSLVETPTVQGRLQSGSETFVDLASTVIDGGSAVADAVDLDSGYYTMSVNLLDGGFVVAGLVEVVRITAGAVTEGNYQFEQINKPGKPIDIQAAYFTIAWDPPASSIVTGYRVYYRNRGSYEWMVLGEVPAVQLPTFTVSEDTLPYGAYEFAISALNGAGESNLHSSMDNSADPAFGWYVVWSGP